MSIAEILPISQKPNTLRPIGLSAGQFTVPVDFYHPLPARDFEGFIDKPEPYRYITVYSCMN